MKITFLISCFFFLTSLGISQNIHATFKESQKGDLYFYWGWNLSAYTTSNLHFEGEDYDFVLDKVIAKDRQTPFSFDAYFNPAKMTIPQYNYKVGYFIKEKWDISLGMDHMKYVVQENQTVKISGKIENTAPNYDGIYQNDDVLISRDFLRFEHTDGLNYLHAELRHSRHLLDKAKLEVNLTGALSTGILIPRTNTSLLGKEKYDEFHLSGYGVSSTIGVRVAFFNNFFVQTEAKGGFINLSDIRTTKYISDKASQSFFFSQINLVFGGIIHTKRREKE